MTVFNAGQYQHRQWFYGLPTDDKPLNVYNGDAFVEINTGKKFLFDKESETWELSDITLSELSENIISALQLATEADIDTGVATGGSNTTIVNTDKNAEVDAWKNALVVVTKVDTGMKYIRFVISNTVDTYTISALPGGIEVEEGDIYQLKIPVNSTNIEKWGNTQLTGRDISGDFAMLQNLQIANAIYDGSMNVATAGIPVMLNADQSCNIVTLTAKLDNVGKILFGNITSQSSELNPGDSIPIQIENLNLIYIDSENDGDGVSYFATGVE